MARRGYHVAYLHRRGALVYAPSRGRLSRCPGCRIASLPQLSEALVSRLTKVPAIPMSWKAIEGVARQRCLIG